MTDSSDSDTPQNTSVQAPCCVCTCDRPAAGIGPHSRQPKCPEHLLEDTEHVRRLQRTVHLQLQPFTAANVPSLRQQVHDTSADLRAVQQAFASARESINEWESRVVRQLTEKLDATQAWLSDCEDIGEYRREEAETEASGDMQKLFQVVFSMLITVDSLKEDFERQERVRVTDVNQVVQVPSLIAQLASGDWTLSIRDLEADGFQRVVKAQLTHFCREPPPVPPKSDELKAQLKSQLQKVMELNASALVQGDSWALVSARWVRLWKEYVGAESTNLSRMADEKYHPGPIDNADILDSVGKMKEDLWENDDFIFMHREAWKLLAEFYKTKQSEPIVRKVVETFMFEHSLEIEVYNLDIKLVELESPGRTFSQEFSRDCQFSDVETTMRSLFKVATDCETRMWVSPSGTNYDLLPNKNFGLKNPVFSSQYVLLEVKSTDGQWQLGDAKRFSPDTSSGCGLLATGGRLNQVAMDDTGFSSKRQADGSSSGLQHIRSKFSQVSIGSTDYSGEPQAPGSSSGQQRTGSNFSHVSNGSAGYSWLLQPGGSVDTGLPPKSAKRRRKKRTQHREINW